MNLGTASNMKLREELRHALVSQGEADANVADGLLLLRFRNDGGLRDHLQRRGHWRLDVHRLLVGHGILVGDNVERVGLLTVAELPDLRGVNKHIYDI